MLTGRSLRTQVETLFTVIRERSTPEELVFICPQPSCHDRTGNRSVNLKNGKTNCWRCNIGGDFTSWAKNLGYPVEADALTDVPIEKLEAELTAQKVPEILLPIQNGIQLPEGFEKLSRNRDSVYYREIAKMAKRKNLEIEDFKRAKAGFCRIGKWERYCVFPVYEEGKLVYFQGRTFAPSVEGEITKKFPSRQEIPYGARFWIYNYDSLLTDHVELVIVTESILNVLSLQRKLLEFDMPEIVPICVFKHSISLSQALKLNRLKLPEICILFDADATDYAWQSIKQLKAKRLSVATMPALNGNKTCDPNDNVEAALFAVVNREEFTERSGLLNRLELAVRAHAYA